MDFLWEALPVVAIIVLLSLPLVRREAWPFTRYPMFSGYVGSHDIRVVRCKLESQDGTTRWWRPSFHRYQDRIGRALARADSAQVLALVAEVMRLVAMDEGSLGGYRAVHVVERRWIGGVIHDRELARFPVRGVPIAT